MTSKTVETFISENEISEINLEKFFWENITISQIKKQVKRDNTLLEKLLEFSKRKF